MSETANKIGLISEGIEKCTDAQIEAIYLIMTGKTQLNAAPKNKKIEAENTTPPAPITAGAVDKKEETVVEKPKEETKADK